MRIRCTILLTVLTILSQIGRGTAIGQEPPGAGSVTQKPVILLTGFEPFGQKRLPNPSWEGIRELDGREIAGHRIVAMQMPVIWSEPRRLIQQQIEQFHPVAVMSFGQGAPDSFAIESKAVNSRAEIPDNAGNTPPEPLITPDGPQQFDSSFPCSQMKDLLSSQGYPIRVSTAAGQYLCEETLYSLEYLRSKKHPHLTVSFCHVPPLGARVGMNGEHLVDRAYIQSFVEDYVKTWIQLQKSAASDAEKTRSETPASGNSGNCEEPQTTAPQSPATAARQPAHPEQAAVEELIERYFKSWSEQRMKDYGDCFADDAVIQELNARRDISTQSKGPFVTTQSTYHKMAIFKATEVPVRTTITFEAELARAVVYWKLTAGPRRQFGYDHFTLVKQDGEWKIANLVFYGTKETE
ncbi:MAG: nuclear transport factor 2 family protein [Planctomycetota bacterium]